MTRVSVPSLLIADDEEPWRATLEQLFQPIGIKTILAENGRQVVEMATAGIVDCMLIDLNMPHLTGLEALRLVRQRRTPPPCVLLTAEADDRVIEQARSLDVFSVLSKPVRREVITEVVVQAFRTLERFRGTFPPNN